MRYVGLDVHKSTVRVCILDDAGGRVLSKTVACSRESLVCFAKADLKPDDVVTLEATTNTWAVVDLLRPFVARVTTSNPLRTKARNKKPNRGGVGLSSSSGSFSGLTE